MTQSSSEAPTGACWKSCRISDDSIIIRRTDRGAVLEVPRKKRANGCRRFGGARWRVPPPPARGFAYAGFNHPSDSSKSRGPWQAPLRGPAGGGGGEGGRGWVGVGLPPLWPPVAPRRHRALLPRCCEGATEGAPPGDNGRQGLKDKRRQGRTPEIRSNTLRWCGEGATEGAPPPGVARPRSPHGPEGRNEAGWAPPTDGRRISGSAPPGPRGTGQARVKRGSSAGRMPADRGLNAGQGWSNAGRPVWALVGCSSGSGAGETPVKRRSNAGQTRRWSNAGRPVPLWPAPAGSPARGAPARSRRRNARLPANGPRAGPKIGRKTGQRDALPPAPRLVESWSKTRLKSRLPANAVARARPSCAELEVGREKHPLDENSTSV